MQLSDQVKEKAAAGTFHIRKGGDGEESGFRTRDIYRFFAVDVIIVIILKLLLGLGFFPTLDAHVLAVLAGRVILFCYLAWLIRERRNAWREAGGATAGRGWAWPLSLAVYAAGYPLILWADRLNIALLRQIHASFGEVFVPTPQNIITLIFEDILASPIRAILVAFTVLIGPFMEELAFRGMGLDAFRRSAGPVRAIFWTSLLFGLYHFSLQMLIPLSLLGAIFAAARLLSRSLWCAVAVHSLHNCFTLAVTAHALGRLDFPAW